MVLVPMPLQLAVFDPDRATEVINAFPEIGTWAIGGHSLGGSMAARYAHHHPDKVSGLMMWDAFAADDMNDSTLKVTLIHRSTEDKQPPPDYTDKLPLLPAQTEYVPLEGGTHLNFGRFIAGRMYRDAPPGELDPDYPKGHGGRGLDCFHERTLAAPGNRPQTRSHASGKRPRQCG